MFFEELVEQHRVNGGVFHTLDLPFSIADCQVGINLLYILGDQAIIEVLIWVDLLLVAISDGLQRVERFARVLHWFDVLFVAQRRRSVTKSAIAKSDGNI